MIYIEHNQKGQMEYINFNPFDEVTGLGKTQEQLELEGVMVDSIPNPLVKEGKKPIMYVNPSTKEIYYEYEDIPETEEDVSNKKIAELEQQLAGLQSAMAELTMMLNTPQ